MRLIINAEPENFIFAVRAAKWLIEQPEAQRDAILSFFSNKGSQDFYAKRNRASITVSEVKRKE